MLHFIIGLPGSGKTFKVAELVNEQLGLLDGRRVLAIDDPVSMQEVESVVAQALESAKVANCVLLVADPMFCNEDTLADAVQAILRQALKDDVLVDIDGIKKTYFANDPKAALANVERRRCEGDCREVRGLVSLLSQRYNPPADATPIWRPAEKCTCQDCVPSPEENRCPRGCECCYTSEENDEELDDCW